MTTLNADALRKMLRSHIQHWRANADSDGVSVNAAVGREVAKGKAEAYQNILESLEKFIIDPHIPSRAAELEAGPGAHPARTDTPEPPQGTPTNPENSPENKGDAPNDAVT